jgi:hypothetical protein
VRGAGVRTMVAPIEGALNVGGQEGSHVFTHESAIASIHDVVGLVPLLGVLGRP